MIHSVSTLFYKDKRAGKDALEVLQRPIKGQTRKVNALNVRSHVRHASLDYRRNAGLAVQAKTSSSTGVNVLKNVHSAQLLTSNQSIVQGVERGVRSAQKKITPYV